MNINRRSIATGLAVGVLAGGAGGAIAATTSGSRTASPSSTTTSSSATGGWDGYGSGWDGSRSDRDGYRSGWDGSRSDRDGYRSGWGGGATGWRDPAPENGRGAWGSDTNIGGTRWTSLARSGRQAAQTYLGLSASQLRSRLQSGKTLAEIASSQGKSVTGLESAIKSAITDNVNANSALTASQKSSIIANLTNTVDSCVTDTTRPWYGGRPTAR